MWLHTKAVSKSGKLLFGQSCIRRVVLFTERNFLFITRGLETLDSLYATFTGDNFSDFLFCFLRTCPLLKRVLLQMDYFSEGKKNNFEKAASPDSAFIPLNPRHADAMTTSNFQPIRLLDPGCWYKFTY